MWGFMQFLGLFFSWWGFFLGIAFGIGLAGVVVPLATPSLYRAQRRRELRRMWRLDEPRPVPTEILPIWTAYDPDNETVDRRCICHQRRIYPGEWVLLWPEVGPGGILHTSVYCEAVKESV